MNTSCSTTADSSNDFEASSDTDDEYHDGDTVCYDESVSGSTSGDVHHTKYCRQSVSLLPGLGARDVVDFSSELNGHNNSSPATKFESAADSDGSSLSDDVIVVEDADDDDSGCGISEIYMVDSSFWVSSSCPRSLYLVAHTDDEAHVIEDCKTGQVYVFQQLTTINHLQLTRKNLSSYLRSTLDPKVPVHFYRNHSNHKNSFCVVLNEPESVCPVIDSMDFQSMHEILSNVDPKDVHGRTRQTDQTRVSYGYATNTCMRRDKSGSSVPNLLKGTLTPFSQHLFVCLSSIFLLSYLPTWASYRGDPKRLVYAKTIAEDNELEGLTFHKSSPNNTCDSHMDGNNPYFSADSQLSLVVGASKWVEGERVGGTGYFRKSISDSILRKEKNAPMLEELFRVYSQFSDVRKHMDPLTLLVYLKEGKYLDKKHVSVPCNMDPLGTFHFPQLDSTSFLPYTYCTFH